MAKKKNNSAVSLITLVDQKAKAAEQYRTIRSNIQFSSVDRELKSIVVTSSGPSEGKSTTSANLAIVFANSGKKVLLVDADLRKPTLALTFKILNPDGLSTLLGDREATCEKYAIETAIPNLAILPSGPKPPNPSELLDSKRMTEVLKQMNDYYDLVIFDMPPVVTVTDAQILAAKTDGTLLVVRERKTSKQGILKAHELLKIANANILGVIYNGAKSQSSSSYYYYG